MNAAGKPMYYPMYYGWVIVALAFLLQAVTSGGVQSLYGVFAVPLADSFGVSRTQILMATASAAMIGSGLLSPLAGLWLQRYSNKLLLLIGGLSLAGGYVLLSQATAVWQIALIYFVCWSVANGLYGTLAANTAVSNWFVAQRGRALGLAAIGISAGTFIFPPLVSALIVRHDWRFACLVLAGIAATTLPLVMFAFHARPEDRGLHPDGASQACCAPTEQVRMTAGAVLRARNFWLLAICISICFAGFNGLMANLVPLAVDSGFGQQKAAYLLSLSAVFGVIGKLAMGASADRLRPALALGLPLLALCCACMTLKAGTSYALLALASSFIGLASGGSIPVWGALIGRLFGRASFSLVMGMMNPLLVPLIVVSAPYISWVNQRYLSYDLALYTIVGLALLAMALASLLRVEAAVAQPVSTAG